MADSSFFKKSKALSLKELAEISGCELHEQANSNAMIEDVAPLDRASENEISFLDNPKYIETFEKSSAGACILHEKYVKNAPYSMNLLISKDPYRSYAMVAQAFYPVLADKGEIDKTAIIDETAIIGENCTISAGAVIGKNVSIGDNSMIGVNAVISDSVKIGKNTRIGALSSISHSIIGNNVIIHRGVHIGQDGFGFALGREGHVKVPQLGRVMVEDNVEIGSGTCIDRGTGPDTIIGEGTKIDNLVQIGHNVQMGKSCIIVSQVGIAGSVRIGDGAMLAGQAGIAGHLKIGSGARVAAQAGVKDDIPNGGAVGGSPAVPIKQWHRQIIALAKLIERKKNNTNEKPNN